MGLLASKGLDSTLIRLCGMDRRNAIGGERPPVQNLSYFTPLNINKLQKPSVSIMPKAHDTKVSHTHRIRWNASVNLEIISL